MRIHIMLLLAVLLAPAASRACDPYHSWQEASSYARKTLTDRGVLAMTLAWLSKMTATGKPLEAGKTIALANLTDGYARSGVVAAGQPAPKALDDAARTAREAQAAKALESALAQVGLKVIPIARTAALLEAGEATPAACARIQKETGADWVLSVRLRDYGQLVRLDSDTVPANKGLLCQYLFETVRARIDLKDATGASVHLDEAQGLARDGWLFMTDGAPTPKVKYFIEYHVERPGQDALAYQLKPGHSHLGLRP